MDRDDLIFAVLAAAFIIPVCLAIVVVPSRELESKDAQIEQLRETINQLENSDVESIEETSPTELEESFHVTPVDNPNINTSSTTRTFRVTAYCPCEQCCGEWADGITASGVPVTANGGKFIAAPPEFEMYTEMIIPGYDSEPVPVLDRGGAIRGDRLDVFFPTHQEALEWGVQYIEVTILE
jgi:3D (Asp-Asp-Asp) domain-containing protein